MILVLAPLLGLAVLALFVQFERKGKPEIAVTVLVATVFVEMLLYPSQNDLQSGLFRIDVGGQSLRLYELIIAVALIVRLYVKGLPRRYSAEGIAWGVFLTWYAATFVIGLLHDNASDLALFQLKAVVYVGGGLIVAAGVPAERYVRRRTVATWLVALGVIAALYAGPSVSSGDKGEESNSESAGLSLGILGADAPTAMVSVALVGLVVEGTHANRRQPLVFVAGLGVLIVPFLVSQRGAIIGLAVCVVLLLALSCGRTWRRRMTTTPVEAGLLVAALAVPVVVLLVVQSVNASIDPDDSAVAVPLVERVNDSFFAGSKAASAETRKNLWSDGLDRIFDKPLVGSGLGTEYDVERVAVDENLVGGGFHNVLVDIAVRAGLPGLLLFAIACSFTFAAAVRTWRRHPDPLVAALAMGALVALAGLFAKGLVESVLEKYRLAVVIGVLLGVVGSASASERRARATLAAEAAAPVTPVRDVPSPSAGVPVEG